MGKVGVLRRVRGRPRDGLRARPGRARLPRAGPDGVQRHRRRRGRRGLQRAGVQTGEHRGGDRLRGRRPQRGCRARDVAGATTIVAVDIKDGALAFAQDVRSHPCRQRAGPRGGRGRPRAGDHRRRRALRVRGLRQQGHHRMAVDMLRKRGTAVIVGIAPIGDAAPIEPWVLTRGEKTITGTYYGSAHPRRTCRASPTGWRAAGSTSPASSRAATGSPTSIARTRTWRTRRRRPRRHRLLGK